MEDHSKSLPAKRMTRKEPISQSLQWNMNFPSIIQEQSNSFTCNQFQVKNVHALVIDHLGIARDYPVNNVLGQEGTGNDRQDGELKAKQNHHGWARGEKVIGDNVDSCSVDATQHYK